MATRSVFLLRYYAVIKRDGRLSFTFYDSTYRKTFYLGRIKHRLLYGAIIFVFVRDSLYSYRVVFRRSYEPYYYYIRVTRA